MPIKLTVTDGRGMITRHHRIAAMSVTEVTVDGVTSEFIDINLYSYANKAIYDAGLATKTDTIVDGKTVPVTTPARDLHYSSQAIRLPIGDGNISKVNIYARIKAEVPAFAAATSE